MIIETLALGDFLANCYCLRADAQAKGCLLIDPGLDAEPLVQFLDEEGLTPAFVVLTHGHADHIGGIETIRQRWPEVRVAIHKADAAMLPDPTANLSLLAGRMVQARPAEVLLG
jgi:hydroxyacylglutathione hydrolase